MSHNYMIQFYLAFQMTWHRIARLSHPIPGLTKKCPDILGLSYIEPDQSKCLRKVEILDYTQKILVSTYIMPNSSPNVPTLNLIDFPTLPTHSTDTDHSGTMTSAHTDSTPWYTECGGAMTLLSIAINILQNIIGLPLF